MIFIPFNQARFIWARAFLSFFKSRYKSLCLKVGRRTKQKSTKNVRNQIIVIITNRTNADVVVDHEMIQYEYSGTIIHVTHMHVYSHNVQLPTVAQSAACLTANPGVMSLCPSQAM